MEKSENFLENMVTRKNFNLPYDVELLADDIEHLCLLDDSQSFISSSFLEDRDYNNLINLMKGRRACTKLGTIAKIPTS
jgi:hypothetical protein